jgi:hypothetical protein
MRAAVDWLKHHVFCRENVWALILCLILIAVMIMSADSSPLWIYQGF